jgi:hypothetical protein
MSGWLALVWGALALQIWPRFFSLDTASSEAALASVLAGYGLVAIFLARLLWILLTTSQFLAGVGALLMAAGWMLNFTVIALNRGMPVSLTAVEKAGRDPERVFRVGVLKHVPASDETRLAFLGDNLALRPLRVAFSPGDVALAAGIAVFVAATMRLPKTRRSHTVPPRAPELRPP